MVARMMRWPPWPPLHSKKFQVKLVLLRLEAPLGLQRPDDAAGGGPTTQEANAETAAQGKKKLLTAEVRWKGPKTTLTSLRRPSIRRNCTRALEALDLRPSKEGEEGEDGEEGSLSGSVSIVEWNEEFRSVCCLTSHKDNAYHPWEVAFSVLDSNGGSSRKMSVIGSASLNLSELVSAAEGKEIQMNIPLTKSGAFPEPSLSILISLGLLEMRPAEESLDARSIVPVPLSPVPGDALHAERDELSALKAGLRKVKIFTELMSARRSKKATGEDEGSEGRCSARSEDGEHSSCPFDTDSPAEEDAEEGDGPAEDHSIRKSFSYGTLASANYFGGSCYSQMRASGEFDDWVYYSHSRSDVGSSSNAAAAGKAAPFPEVSSSLQPSRRSILPWRKRKLSFRSPKARGEPLLKKAYGEEGGDDIDYDRRQLSSSDESLMLPPKGGHEAAGAAGAAGQQLLRGSEFGDEGFAVGSWEEKEVVSRDGRMKIRTQVFFASIDQRSEQAAGESACTALVAVVADWLQGNGDAMPIKSQFDSLIRDGSREWRSLCEHEAYRERFPDRHFDLDTVLQAKIRPLSVVAGKSFVGFFHPEGTTSTAATTATGGDGGGGGGGGDSGFDFLQGAMSFDSIWDEVSRAAGEQRRRPPAAGGSPQQQVYIVSWNDHFFVLKVEEAAYYIIDTLGERLHEGCSQAYILKFDDATTISLLPSPSQKPTAAGEAAVAPPETHQQAAAAAAAGGEEEAAAEAEEAEAEEEVVVCRGKESCKEYIKSFLAAIPIRELQADVRKGLMASTPIHHRLQIEFHFTEPSSPPAAVDPPAPPPPPPPPESPEQSTAAALV